MFKTQVCANSLRTSNPEKTVRRSLFQEHLAFMYAGDMGMYNMGLVGVDQLKSVKKGELVDRIGREEMDAHLFRTTQTDARINRENIRGQKPLENAARRVGKTVRETMTNAIGAVPENLAPVENIHSEKI